MENELKTILDPEKVSQDPEFLDKYSEDLSFVPPQKPAAVIKPENAKEIQKIVRLANDEQIPLIPVSSGPPRFRGDTVPRTGDSIILDLSKMDEIKMINRGDRVAMVEPGVRFGELQEELEKEGMRLPTPLCPRKTKSVLASALEREPHIIPKFHLDHSEPLLCSENVNGYGALFKTGEAADYGTIEEQWEDGRYQKIGMDNGMNIKRLIQGAQGTMAIMTWGTVRCEILPEIQESYLAAEDEVEKLLEFGYRLIRYKLADELFILNNKNLALLMGDSKEDIEDLSDSLPYWILSYTLSGYNYRPEERIDYLKSDVEKEVNKSDVSPSEEIDGISGNEILEAASNPSEEPYWKIKQKGGCQDIYFIAKRDNIPHYVNIVMENAEEQDYPSSDIGVYLQPVCQGHGHHCEFNIPYNPEDEEEKEKVKDFYESACEELIEEGAFFSRPYGIITDKVYERDASTVKVLNEMKNIFDPNNVLNPGKLCFDV